MWWWTTHREDQAVFQFSNMCLLTSTIKLPSSECQKSRSDRCCWSGWTPAEDRGDGYREDVSGIYPLKWRPVSPMYFILLCFQMRAYMMLRLVCVNSFFGGIAPASGSSKPGLSHCLHLYRTIQRMLYIFSNTCDLRYSRPLLWKEIRVFVFSWVWHFGVTCN